jgi:hypothetical protein
MHAPLKTLKELSSRLHSHASDNSADASAVDEGHPLRPAGSTGRMPHADLSAERVSEVVSVLGRVESKV